ncbi:indolepyruvate ferredoxin oxidoreductase subunit alpha [Tuwongella immobilis]|uniref:Ferredoxin n=1 Tax=Tuwongella immobilis TaxID=692036 RepID=A0A6C2YPW0_9BACT|nr:ferredoxin family protein [Tuwongella immobilis]VIP03387.1 ferredoxin : Ferredoxin OS=Dyella japonica A8 GN=HY57_17590 PE=4 SV=1: Fer4_10 [Tuwongella immobilis]VTS04146.1 ferredoxin : Ferredoxin OS=Dyella japonica A8 GN=HY57_17590 PE=4 SV=1: Fer4_10 [Tuwongella immobilis]
MAMVVTDPCIGCKSTDCVVVCPTDAFHDAGEQLVIDPEVCIDCGACAAECPTNAIYPEDEVPTQWIAAISLNARLARIAPGITEPIRRSTS